MKRLPNVHKATEHVDMPEKPRGVLHLEPRWLSLQVAAEYCSISRRELRKLIQKGEIKASCTPGGRKLRIDRFSLDNFMEQNVVNIDAVFIEETVAKLKEGAVKCKP